MTYQICTKTVMDTSDDQIKFDINGISNHWYEYKLKARKEILTGKRGLDFIKKISGEIIKENKNKPYDCLIGLSGGVDSSYVAYWVKKLGLRALAVHVDNGWNSELAVANIEKIVKKLNIELHTEVLDWIEFRDLQRSFFLASVPNCEIPTDHAIVATLFRLSVKFGIKYILSGSNLTTEGVYQKFSTDNKDSVNIKNIHKLFGTVKIQKYPYLNIYNFAKIIFFNRVKFIPILNYLDYNKDEAINKLQEELGWRKYERKHGESIFTRFFQEYYLPKKFGIDKRKMHFSSLICSNQITREEAIELLKKPLYKKKELETDLDFVCKKLNFSRSQFNDIMNLNPKKHTDYDVGIITRFRNSMMYKYARNFTTSRNKLKSN